MNREITLYMTSPAAKSWVATRTFLAPRVPTASRASTVTFIDLGGKYLGYPDSHDSVSMGKGNNPWFGAHLRRVLSPAHWKAGTRMREKGKFIRTHGQRNKADI